MLRSHRRLLSAGAAALLVFGIAACGGTTKDSTDNSGAAAQTGASADPNAKLKEGLKIAYLPKQLNNPYSDVEVSGGKTAVEELKGEYKLVGPNDASASTQVSYINTLIQQQQDVIVIAANDPNAVCPSLNQARQAGIKVVAFDSDAAKECRDAFINQVAFGIRPAMMHAIAHCPQEFRATRGRWRALAHDPDATGDPSARRLMRLAATPAPKPLSTFTTVMPAAQLFIIASSAARPPKLAP